MSYTNDAGVLRQIWMPKGTATTAGQLFEKKDWKALEKWPTYADQGYKDEGEEEEKERKEWEWLVIGEKGKDGKEHEVDKEDKEEA
ncbi:hypothetical protein VTL71DRAFT_15740 [Oculimacula yallundae]|uniref:Uncharacterized protein n=1 Tax=Oculimacula yallundae TaxID=86028 RepID=A0ABR4CCH1_9HELO